MEVIDQLHLKIADPSGAGEARRLASDLGRRLGLDEHVVGRLAIVVTETATNLVKHAAGGEMVLHGLQLNGACGVGMIALDRGPGFANVAEAMRDGFSRTGTPGTGLGAIRRQATTFDLYSTPGAGAALSATVWAQPPAPTALCAGGINVPHPMETVSGDAWDVVGDGPCARVLMCDGLGHGVQARDASAFGVELSRRHPHAAPGDLLERLHAGLRSTRGAAGAAAQLDLGSGVVRFAGIGNIAATIVGAGGATRSLVSHHGTLGHDVRRVQEFTYPWEAGAVLVMHSDGLTTHWLLDRYPGLTSREPALMAGVLYRDFARGRDDASVVVLRETR